MVTRSVKFGFTRSGLALTTWSGGVGLPRMAPSMSTYPSLNSKALQSHTETTFSPAA